MNHRTGVRISALLLMTPGLVVAASHNKAVYIGQYDLDDDGRLAWQEFDTARQVRFARTDENQDGVVDAEEYVYEWEDHIDRQFAADRQGQVDQAHTRFDSLDDDGNDKLVWAEFNASADRIFASLDVNRDGTINDADPVPENARSRSRDDRYQLDPSLSEAERDKRYQDLVETAERRMLTMPTTHTRAGTMDIYDQDEDGAVTRAEFDRARQTQFARADFDGNDWISEDEYVMEYEDRLDAEIARAREAQVKQAYVRFNALDDNENGLMTFDEYQMSGKRSFTRWDTDENLVVTMGEAEPAPRNREDND